jgi:hypothetical protein
VVLDGDVVDWYEARRLLNVEFALTRRGASHTPTARERLVGLKEESDYEGKPAGELIGGKSKRDH